MTVANATLHSVSLCLPVAGQVPLPGILRRGGTRAGTQKKASL